jgi:hypothetical protein
MRIVRDFLARTSPEQQWLCENSWCASCAEADLGIDEPVEYEEDGQVFLEGRCRACGVLVCTLLIEQVLTPPSGG